MPVYEYVYLRDSPGRVTQSINDCDVLFSEPYLFISLIFIYLGTSFLVHHNIVVIVIILLYRLVLTFFFLLVFGHQIAFIIHLNRVAT